jgi:GT2 family glycosyltransferase
MMPSLFAVIVLYRVPIESCVTYRTLLRASNLVEQGAARLSILLYDNSPEPQTPVDVPPSVSYRHSARNDGVAGAYNVALKLAQEAGCDWLLTLDQDTTLPEHFLLDLLPCAERLATDMSVAAIVPQVFHAGRMISPHFYVAGAWPRFLPAGFDGMAPAPLFAINSASLLRTAAVAGIGGYDPAFWLDASDHSLFSRLARAGGRVYVLGGLQVEQQLSHLDHDAPLSPERQRNILEAESAFWDLERSAAAGFAYTLVLVRHLAGMVRRSEDPKRRALVLRSIVDRLIHSRSFRRRRWQRQALPSQRV